MSSDGAAKWNGPPYRMRQRDPREPAQQYHQRRAR